jgi:hypothetical protein
MCSIVEHANFGGMHTFFIDMKRATNHTRIVANSGAIVVNESVLSNNILDASDGTQ